MQDVCTQGTDLGRGDGTPMSESGRRANTTLRVSVGAWLVVGLFFWIDRGTVAYLNWSANRGARNFCADIAIGSTISAAVAEAKERKILQGSSGQEFSVYFPGLVFDNSLWEVVVTQAERSINRLRMDTTSHVDCGRGTAWGWVVHLQTSGGARAEHRRRWDADIGEGAQECAGSDRRRR